MSEFSTTRGEIGGLSVSQLAERFGTPVYVYEAETIRQRLAGLRDFDVVRYAQKACSNLTILEVVRRAGGLVDCVSGNEIRRALAAGFQPRGDPPPIVYTADLFDRDALELVVEHDVHVNCGSPEMIDQYGEAASGRDITLRVNPGFGNGHHRKTNTGGDCSKHGIWHEQLNDCLERAARVGLRVVGVHIHIGSGADLAHLRRICESLENAANRVGDSIRAISVGGGLPTRYREEDETVDPARYFAACDESRRRLEQSFAHDVRLEIEPGRYVVADSGFLIAEVRAVKHMGENLFYLIDAGFNNLARPILYGAYHPISLATSGDERRASPTRPVIVGGPLCESGDIFTQEEGGLVRNIELPLAQVGDYLVIERAGAYGFVMGSNYNSRPFAAEVIIDDGQARLIRRRQTFDDLISCEKIEGTS